MTSLKLLFWLSTIPLHFESYTF